MAFCLFIGVIQLIKIFKKVEPEEAKPVNLSHIYLIVFYSLQFLVLLSLPQIVFNFLGLIMFNAFPGEVKVKDIPDSPLKWMELPHLCFRVVTRGLYPNLVQTNLNKNHQTCIEAGLQNFSIEIVTDNEINLMTSDPNKIRELVVPKSYQTSTSAMYKARALQYALEPDINVLNKGDYIVHLDEETLLTRNSINGIINFARDGKHAFGQGYITYGNQEIVNWITTLADSFRVADDMGKLRFQFYVFHKPLFSWKGSYVVSKYEAETDVTYDHGPDGSIAEDCYFSMVAYKKGYSFNFIEGEMWEKSPFTLEDLIRQRKRWIQGIWLVVHSNKIPLHIKFFLATSLYAWSTLPLTTLSFLTAPFFPVPHTVWLSSIGSFCFATSIYMYIFGVLKTFDLKRTNIAMMFVYLLGAVITLSLNIIIENIAVIWGIIGPKHQFYIVKKDLNSKIVLDA